MERIGGATLQPILRRKIEMNIEIKTLTGNYENPRSMIVAI